MKCKQNQRVSEVVVSIASDTYHTPTYAHKRTQRKKHKERKKIEPVEWVIRRFRLFRQLAMHSAIDFHFIRSCCMILLYIPVGIALSSMNNIRDFRVNVKRNFTVRLWMYVYFVYMLLQIVVERRSVFWTAALLIIFNELVFAPICPRDHWMNGYNGK